MTAFISIINKNDLIGDILRQQFTDIKIHNYQSPAKLLNKLDLSAINIVIIDSNNELEPDVEAFIKHYNALTMIVLLNDFSHHNQIYLGKINMIQKPFSIALLYNLVAKLRQKPPLIFKFSDKIYFNHTQRLIIQLLSNYITKEINLTEKESELLYFLVLHQDFGPISKEKLLSKIFGYKDPTDSHTLETHIYRLRQKIPQGSNIFSNNDNNYSLKIILSKN